jgi:hypothetical protein
VSKPTGDFVAPVQKRLSFYLQQAEQFRSAQAANCYAVLQFSYLSEILVLSLPKQTASTALKQQMA